MPGFRLPDSVKRLAVNQVVQDGRRPAEVALELGVSRQSVLLWVERFTSENPERPLGRPKQRPLTEEERRAVKRALTESKPSDHRIQAHPDEWGLASAKRYLSKTFGLNYTYGYIHGALAGMGVELPKSAPLPETIAAPSPPPEAKRKRGRPPQKRRADERSRKRGARRSGDV